MGGLDLSPYGIHLEVLPGRSQNDEQLGFDNAYAMGKVYVRKPVWTSYLWRNIWSGIHPVRTQRSVPELLPGKS